ncbi:hypothetical protein [Actinomadura sp. WAC 06369]|uniref:hypothetical protein n=1 Tax=Actinomadura sp. WAC 06369 TaxID=2203193 RepID=UPI000F79A4D9|nr:hypothetical protein [Actinomadura sp. WAC 06369]RSN51944.1 hypothetical protein DMH08_29465 [Actinomadura sp. WAC 06369]
MQCPTCGSNTPGTLGKCANCGGPVDAYAPGAPPLAAPVADASADAFGESTMMVPPPNPSWTQSAPANPVQPGPGAPAAPPMPSAPQAMPSGPQPMQPGPAAPSVPSAPPMPFAADPMQSGPSVPAMPSNPGAPAAPVPSGAGFPGLPDTGIDLAGPGATVRDMPSTGDRLVDTSGTPKVPGADGPAEATGESTAPWAFDPDDDDDEPEVDIPELGGPARPALPAAAAAAPPPSNPFGLADAPRPTESIVPDSWFAQPRKPQEPEAATQVWTPQPAPAAGCGVHTCGAASASCGLGGVAKPESPAM